MTESTIATKIHQALDVHCSFTTQIAFNRELCDTFAQSLHLGFRQVLDLGILGNASRVTYFSGRGATDAKNGSQRDHRVLMIRDVYPSNTSHSQYPERETKNYNMSAQ